MRHAPRAHASRPRLLWALLIPLGLSSVLFMYGAAQRLTVPYGLEYGEGIVLSQAINIVSPGEAYHPISRYPFVVFHYPPAFHLWSRLASIAVGDLLVAGRIVTWCSALGIMAVLAALVARSKGVDGAPKWIGAAAAALLPASVPAVRDWVPHMRVDVCAIFFTLLGVFLLLEGQRRPVFRYAACVSFVVALFTKQTMVAAPLAGLIATALDDRKRALALAAVIAGVAIPPFVAMQWVTNGEFARHLFVHNQNSYSVDWARQLVTANAIGAFPLLLLAAIGLGVIWWTRGATPAPRLDAGTAHYLSIYVVLAFLVTWTSGKFGSASNYFLELDLACCLLAGLGVARVLAASPGRGWQVAAVGMLLLVAGVRPLATLAEDAFHATESSRAASASRLDEWQQTLAVVRGVEGPVLSWDVMVPVRANKEIALEPAIMIDLARRGRWDATPFLQQIHGRYYSLVIVNSYADWLPWAEVSAAIAVAYAPAERFGSYQLYRPSPQ